MTITGLTAWYTLTNINIYSLATDDVEYSTLYHLPYEMLWNNPHHFVKGRAGANVAIECYVSIRI